MNFTKFKPVEGKERRYGVPRCFMPAGRINGPVIYAVTLFEHPDIVKVGRTTKWTGRIRQYQNWNLRPGDALNQARVFRITDEYVDLESLEKAILHRMPYAPYRGQEWFRATIEDAVEVIDREMTRNDISFILE